MQTDLFKRPSWMDQIDETVRCGLKEAYHRHRQLGLTDGAARAAIIETLQGLMPTATYPELATAVALIIAGRA